MTYVIIAAIVGVAILLYFVLDKKEASLPATIIAKPPAYVVPPNPPQEKNGDHEGDQHGGHSKDVGSDMGVDKK